jgi:hypothetical protein
MSALASRKLRRRMLWVLLACLLWAAVFGLLLARLVAGTAISGPWVAVLAGSAFGATATVYRLSRRATSDNPLPA